MALGEYDDELDKAIPVDQFGKVKLEHLPDGDYKFEIAQLRINDDKDLIALDLIILNEGPLHGLKTERPYWMSENEKKDGEKTGKRISSTRSKSDLDRDLKKMGFDMDELKKVTGKTWLGVVRMIPSSCKGIGVLASKSHKAGDRGGVFHNLFINKRSGDDGKPEKFTAEDLNTADRDPFDGSSGAGAGAENEEEAVPA